MLICLPGKRRLSPMHKKPTYHDLEQKIKALEEASIESERLQEALRKSEEQYRSLFVHSKDAILLTRPDGAILDANPAACEMFGRSLEEIRRAGRDGLVDVTDPRLHATLRERARKSAASTEITLLRANGEKFSAEVTSTIFVDAKGRHKTSMIVRDMTERRKAEQDYQRLFREMLDGFALHEIICDEQGNPVDYRFLAVNPAFERMTGLKAEQIVGRTVLEILPGTERRWIEIYGRVALTGEPAFFENYAEALDKYFVVSAFQPASHQFACFFVDITDRKRAEEKLLLTQAVMDRAPDSIIWVDDQGNLIYVNEATCASLGYTREELLNMTLFDIDPDWVREGYDDEVKKLKRLGSMTFEARHRTKDGRIFPVEVTDNHLEYKGRFVSVAFDRDITDRKRAEEKLRKSEQRYRELSIVDDLTRLYNSRQFYIQLKVETDRANRYKQPLTLLFLDLDDFKVFNDTYGHIKGDTVLRQTGQIITRCLRETDFAYRYGGEEFTVILPMTTKEDGAAIAERIRSEIKEENFSPLPDRTLHLTASIGLAQYQLKEKVKAYVQRADRLMYRGKQEGKDRVCYEP